MPGRQQDHARAGAADRHPRRIDGGQADQPFQRGVAVVERRGVGMLGGQAIVHRRDGDSECAGEPAAQRVVLLRRSRDVPAAVDPQQSGRGVGDPDGAMQSHAGARCDGEHLDIAGLTTTLQRHHGPNEPQRRRPDRLAGREPGHRAEVRMEGVGHTQTPSRRPVFRVPKMSAAIVAPSLSASQRF